MRPRIEAQSTNLDARKSSRSLDTSPRRALRFPSSLQCGLTKLARCKSRRAIDALHQPGSDLRPMGQIELHPNWNGVQHRCDHEVRHVPGFAAEVRRAIQLSLEDIELRFQCCFGLSGDALVAF